MTAQTSNPHCDTVRQIAAAHRHPAPLPELDLISAIKLATLAREQLLLAYKALRPDDALRAHAEAAGRSVKDLVTAARARLPQRPLQGRAH